ncbi:MAG: ribonuclease HII [Chitinophagaceae bacterium]|nr:ribonuclease HII [Chitinophagaceae bacterium]
MLLPFLHEHLLEAGCDEAGRGCIAGPVCAAAVILPKNFNHSLINDSKKLSESVREELRVVIEREALAWAVSFVSPQKIDQINILKASILAMHQAVAQLTVEPEFLLIDGNRFYPYSNIPHTCVIKGDGKYTAIAAASILAKTHRDEYMMGLDKKFPNYLWLKNKGYPTVEHRSMIRQYGMTKHHRKSFACLPKQPVLFNEC